MAGLPGHRPGGTGLQWLELEGGSEAARPPTTLHNAETSAQRCERGVVSIDGEQTEVDHSEGVRVGAEERAPRRVADDRVPAAFHRAVEHLGHDAAADAGQPSVVELGLAEYVEPQGRVLASGRGCASRRPPENRRRSSSAPREVRSKEFKRPGKISDDLMRWRAVVLPGITPSE